jgi:peptidoglycan/LPS O-acetylase OafA/YrhL
MAQPDGTSFEDGAQSLTKTETTRDRPFVIPSLDGIRALAVTSVFAGHAGITNSPAPLGVTVFFFLSGFLITTLLRMEFEKTGTISFRAFYLRRALRLFPPLYLVLTIACVLSLVGFFGAVHLRGTAVAAQFFYLSNYQILQSGWDGPWSGRPPGTGDLWSLAVEEHFYLLFPLLYLGLRRYLPSPRRQLLVLAAICAVVLAWRLILIYALHSSYDRAIIGSDTRIDSILFGCMLGIWGNPVLDREPAARGARSLAIPLLAVLGAITIYLTLKLTDAGIMATAMYTIQGIALVPLFIAAVRFHKWGPFRLLNLRPVRFLGTLSYSMYIVQQIVITGLHDRIQAPHVVKGIAYLAVTLLIATGIHYFVERPVAGLRRRLNRAGAPSVTGPRAAASIPSIVPARIPINIATRNQ